VVLGAANAGQASKTIKNGSTEGECGVMILLTLLITFILYPRSA
jgi:hypothetical protein